MRKRVLSPARDDSSSSSLSPRSKQPCLRLQLLHHLPAPLFSVVCSFLSLYQVVCILRSTCRALHDGVTADCLLRHHLSIDMLSLPSLVASKPSTRALIRRISSLTIVYVHQEEETDERMAMLPLHALRCPVDASRFLFSSLSSLRLSFAQYNPEAHCPPLVKQNLLLNALLLLAAEAESLSSLRRFHLDDDIFTEEGAVAPLSLLQRLRGLIHCRFDWMTQPRPQSSSSLLQALVSMSPLTCLHMSTAMDAGRQLLELLCTDAATPLLLRLRSLVLPASVGDGSMDEPCDAFLRRLSSLPAPLALQVFAGLDAGYRAAGLLTVFSLPHLTVLRLEGKCERLSSVLSPRASPLRLLLSSRWCCLRSAASLTTTARRSLPDRRMQRR